MIRIIFLIVLYGTKVESADCLSVAKRVVDKCDEQLVMYEKTMASQNEVIARQASDLEKLTAQTDELKESLREAKEIYESAKRKCLTGM